jgi:hypothetical protein
MDVEREAGEGSSRECGQLNKTGLDCLIGCMYSASGGRRTVKPSENRYSKEGLELPIRKIERYPKTKKETRTGGLEKQGK